MEMGGSLNMAWRGMVVSALIIQLLACGTRGSTSQSASRPGRPDLTQNQAQRIAPFPPAGVVARQKRASAVISWKRNALDPTVRFRVYRLIGPKSVPLGIVSGDSFKDEKPPSGEVYYQVSSINQYGVESVPSPPVKLNR